MNAKSEHTPPFKTTAILTAEQWQKARYMWKTLKMDTHAIACAMGCTEAHIYSAMAYLKGLQ